MEKPIVFLSHSSKDKASLAELKQLLDTRAAGAIEFFLSSDGQSIRFGRNWVVRISDALAKAKLMFVFLSPHSANSKWIHFEAGCAYANDIQVVPVCLPGMDLNRMVAPLNLLQGFNLHSHEALGNLARTCNETFDLKLPETFAAEDFSMLARPMADESFFLQYSSLIDTVQVQLEFKYPAGQALEPLATLREAARTSGTEALVHNEQNGAARQLAQVDLPGCSIQVDHFLNKDTGGTLKCQGQLSPTLFRLDATVLHKWNSLAGLSADWQATVVWGPSVASETARHKITAKIHNSGVHMTDSSVNFDFEGLRFELFGGRGCYLQYRCSGSLADPRLPRLIAILFEREVLVEIAPQTYSDYE